MALDSERSGQSKDYSKRAKDAAEDSVRRYETAFRAIEYAGSAIKDARRARVDTGEAERHLSKAQEAMKSNMYDDANVWAERAVSATFPKPNIGKEVLLRSVIARDREKIIYKIEVQNKIGNPLTDIKIIPDLSNTPYAAKVQEMTVDLPPFKEEVLYFELLPLDENEFANLEGFIPGRDGPVYTIMGNDDDGLYYKIKLVNEGDKPMRNIRLSPFVPEGYVATPPERIENLKASSTMVFDFRLVPEKDVPTKEEEFECPFCHGTFITNDRIPVVVCPWCNSQIKMAAIRDGGKKKPVHHKQKHAKKQVKHKKQPRPRQGQTSAHVGQHPAPGHHHTPDHRQARADSYQHPQHGGAHAGGAVRPKPRKHHPRTETSGGSGGSYAENVCQVCGGEGTVLIKGDGGKLTKERCPRCDGVGMT